jgi:protein ImuB
LKSRPVEITVVSTVPAGPPLRFFWNKESHAIARSWGPERIETGWWRGNDISRDYFLVESTNGNRFWIYRSLEDGMWFLHGTFA